jgi:hypothetical protein
MSYESIGVGEKVLVYLDDGNEIGGTVSEKTDQALRLSGASKVKEEWVAGINEMVITKGEDLGDVEIEADRIIRWRGYPATL